jgi:hypothetical protein
MLTRTFTVLALIASAVFAAPVEEDATLAARQLGTTSNDITNGVCRGTTLIFARGTTESGNMGSVSLEL